MRMRNKDQLKRPDGTEIDAVRDLAEFVQGIPASPDPEPMAAPEPAAEEPPLAIAPVQISDPEFAGKSTDEIILVAKQERDRRAQLERDLDTQRRQQELDTAARRAVDERIPRPPLQPPAPPPPDNRLAQLDELWFSDPPKARQLLQEIQEEKLARKAVEIEQALENKQTAKERKAQGDWAYKSAIEYLQNSGAAVNADRITAVYTVITRKPSPGMPNQYYDSGGPLSPQVITKAYADLFGLPQGGVAQLIQPSAAPIPPTPPGSYAPAPAAASPQRQPRSAPISAEQKRDIEHLAESFGYDKEKMLNRRRTRLGGEK